MQLPPTRRDPLARSLAPVRYRTEHGAGVLVHLTDDQRMRTLCRVRSAEHRAKTTDPDRVTCPKCLDRLKTTTLR